MEIIATLEIIDHWILLSDYVKESQKIIITSDCEKKNTYDFSLLLEICPLL